MSDFVCQKTRFQESNQLCNVRWLYEVFIRHMKIVKINQMQENWQNRYNSVLFVF